MKTKIIGFILLTVAITAFRYSDDEGKIVSESEFREYVDTIGLNFTMPDGFKETIVKENRDLWYSFAIKNEKEDFEVRFTVWPLKSTIEEYEKCKLDTNCFMVNPNRIYMGRIQANVLNMTGGEHSSSDPFPAKAVKEEFNADAGGSSFFEFNCTFGEGYKYGQMVYLHKDDVADVIITYMSNDKTKHSDLMFSAFYALTFK